MPFTMTSKNQAVSSFSIQWGQSRMRYQLKIICIFLNKVNGKAGHIDSAYCTSSLVEFVSWCIREQCVLQPAVSAILRTVTLKMIQSRSKWEEEKGRKRDMKDRRNGYWHGPFVANVRILWSPRHKDIQLYMLGDIALLGKPRYYTDHCWEQVSEDTLTLTRLRGVTSESKRESGRGGSEESQNITVYGRSRFKASERRGTSRESCTS